MPLGNLNHPPYISGMANPSDWINQALSFLELLSVNDGVERITALPSNIVAGRIYLIGAGSTYSTPGKLVIFLTTASGSAMDCSPPVGFVQDGWVKTSTDWVRTQFAPKSLVIYTASATVILPTTFDGTCQVVVDTSAGVTINGASGRTNKGLAGTSLPEGIYWVYQSSTSCIIS